jgi:protein phosphatase 2C
VLCRGGDGATPVALSSDHKPDRPDEQERIEAAGGRVIFWEGARVLGVLAMSRAIGDGYLKPYVCSVPEVTVAELADGDECLILASDGLWDVVSNEAACEVARACLRRGREKWCAEAAALLTKLALARRSADNVSVVVVDLRRKNR